MVCPRCGHENSAESVACEKCTTPLPISDQTLATGAEGWSVPVGDVIVSPASLVPLTPGSSLGMRYEIIRLLGQGGMGSVYCSMREWKGTNHTSSKRAAVSAEIREKSRDYLQIRKASKIIQIT